MCSDFYDVCIIGASIAGNYLAHLLSNSNMKIVLFEEHGNIGFPFQCAGIISQKIAQLIDLPDNIILNRVKIAKLLSPTGSSIKLSGNEQPYIVDRVALDRLFFEKNKNCVNITYFLNEKFRSFKYIMENNHKEILVETNKRLIKAKMLIGCDGPVSSVGKSMKVKNRLLFASQIRIRGNFNENEAVMYFHPMWKELFGWIVPEGNRVYRIGIACSKNIKECFRYYLEKINIDINDKIDQQGGIIPHGIMKKCAFDNVLLLGDAACQVKATTGGGIIMLLTAANVAANAIRISFNLNNFSDKILKLNYEKPCKKLIGKELKIHYIIRRILEKFGPDDYDTVFTILRTHHIEHQISLYGDMDFPKRLIYQLLRNGKVLKFLLKFFFHHPRLLGTILIVILKN